MRNPPSVSLDSGFSTIVGYLRDAPNGQIWNNSLEVWEPDGTPISAAHLMSTTELNPYASKSDYELSKAQCDKALNATDAESLQVRFYDTSGPTKVGIAEYSSPYDFVPILWTPENFLQDVDVQLDEISGQTELIRGNFVVPSGLTVTNSGTDPNNVTAANHLGTSRVVTVSHTPGQTEGMITVQPVDGDDYIVVRLTTTIEGEVRSTSNIVNKRQVLELAAQASGSAGTIDAVDADLIAARVLYMSLQEADAHQTNIGRNPKLQSLYGTTQAIVGRRSLSCESGDPMQIVYLADNTNVLGTIDLSVDNQDCVTTVRTSTKIDCGGCS